MAKVTINNKEYELDDLSDEAKQYLASLQYAQNEIKRAQGLLACLNTAASTYSKLLEDNLPST
tara:strand:+ start:623 stop:811 length:189 start_codon:yes stop_codon:yes gene_type:complete